MKWSHWVRLPDFNPGTSFTPPEGLFVLNFLSNNICRNIMDIPVVWGRLCLVL